MQAMQPPEKVNIFYCYAQEDQYWQRRLQNHLSNLRHQGLINDLNSRDIKAGQNWRQTVDTYLDNAHIILLLISADFMSSDYCQSIEMARAIERYKTEETWVIPILLRSADTGGAPFSKLQTLPINQRPVTLWNNKDEAFKHITLELRKVIFDILDKPDPVDEQFEQFVLIDNTPKTSRSTRATSPSASTRGRSTNRSTKQNPAQVLSDTAVAGIGAHSIRRRSFPGTYRNSMLDNLKELIRGIDIIDFFRFLVTTSVNPKKFRRYSKGILLLGFCFFMICDVIIATAGINYWLHSPAITIILSIILLLLFLWNSCNEHTFTSIVLSLLLAAVWFMLGTHYVTQLPFLVILLASSISFYFRLLLVKPKK